MYTKYQLSLIMSQRIQKEKDKEKKEIIVIEEAVQAYFRDKRELEKLDTKIKELSDENKKVKSNLVKTGQLIHRALKGTKSDSLLVEDEYKGKIVQYIMLPKW